MSKEDVRIIVFDTETANMEGGIVDIALIEIDMDLNQVDELESLIDPQRPISFGAMGVHNITEDMVKDAPTISEFVQTYGNPFEHDNLIVAGHNIKFDLGVLAEHDLLPKEYRFFDTLKLARQVYPEADNHKLQTLRYMLGLTAGPAHRAMGDTVTCLSLARHIAAEQGTDVSGLLTMMSQPISMHNTMGFGKHRGEKIRDVPMGWIDWYLKQPDNDPDLREVFLSRKNQAR